MIVLATDFGWLGPYVGQLKLAVAERNAHLTVIDLIHDLPRFNVRAASYLLASYSRALPVETIVVAVVDPGVGSSERLPVAVEADGRWFVGPGNGLFDQVIAASRSYRCWQLTWRPPQLSNSFHGRDIFAPVAAQLAEGVPISALAIPHEYQPRGWPADHAEVIYLDHYGNGVTGLRAAAFAESATLTVNGMRLRRARIFAELPVGAPFCYENSSGLLEIAVNQGSAAQQLHLAIGTLVTLD